MKTGLFVLVESTTQGPHKGKVGMEGSEKVILYILQTFICKHRIGYTVFSIVLICQLRVHDSEHKTCYNMTTQKMFEKSHV